MRVFRRVSKLANGRKSESRRWTIEIRDHHERVRRLTAFTDRKATEEAGRKVERLIGAKLSGMQPDTQLVQWLETIPDSMRNKLAEWEIIDGGRVAATKGIDEHIADYENELRNRNRSINHINTTTARLCSLMDSCKIKTLSQLTATRISNELAKRRSEGLSTQTANTYLTTAKSFTRWLIREGRLSTNPLAYMKAGNVAVDRRLQRRALSPDEARRLIEVASRGEVSYGMEGTDRGVLYRIAIESGLRANELRGLIRSDFDLTSETPTVRVRAVNAKNRKDQRVPLRGDTVDLLRDYLRLIHPGAKVFNLTKWHTAKMLRKDLQVAREEWINEAVNDPTEWERRRESGFLTVENEAGTVDFHSLRHTCASWLAASGVPITTAREIMRHSDIQLTAAIYSHAGDDMKTQAVESIPGLDIHHGREIERATGTDDRVSPIEKSCARHKAQNDRKHDISGDGMRLTGRDIDNSLSSQNPVKQGKNCVPDTKNQSAPGRIRTCDLRFRKPLLYPAELRVHNKIITIKMTIPSPYHRPLRPPC